MPDFCWFCGRADRPIVAQGYAIGNMVYSSGIHPSSEVLWENYDQPPETPQWVWDHQLKDRVEVCSGCIASMSLQIGELPAAYLNEHLQREEVQLAEAADIDTGLKSWKDATFQFGCWLSAFPDLRVKQKFYALDIGELFNRGFRFSGRVTFGNEEFEQFLQRYATGTSNATDRFIEHTREHIAISDSRSLAELARVQPVIYDVSVWLVINGDKISQSRPRQSLNAERQS